MSGPEHNDQVEFFPGTREPVPSLLTPAEAALYLRLTEDSGDAEAARRRINRLVDQRKVRPCLVGGKRCYSRWELDRFIQEETERYGEIR